jgi:hypothetical protein
VSTARDGGRFGSKSRSHNLQLDGFAVNLERFDFEVNAYGADVRVCPRVVGKAQQQTLTGKKDFCEKGKKKGSKKDERRSHSSCRRPSRQSTGF